MMEIVDMPFSNDKPYTTSDGYWRRKPYGIYGLCVDFVSAPEI